jgi:hypothetical protein
MDIHENVSKGGAFELVPKWISLEGSLQDNDPPYLPSLIVIILNFQPLELERSAFTFVQYSLMMDVLNSSANIFCATDHWVIRILVFPRQEPESLQQR